MTDGKHRGPVPAITVLCARKITSQIRVRIPSSRTGVIAESRDSILGNTRFLVAKGASVDKMHRRDDIIGTKAPCRFAVSAQGRQVRSADSALQINGCSNLSGKPPSALFPHALRQSKHNSMCLEGAPQAGMLQSNGLPP